MADLEIIETAKPRPISHCLTGNVVFGHRVTGHFGPFLITPSNTVLNAEPGDTRIFSRYIG